MSNIIQALEEGNILKVKQAIKAGEDMNQTIMVGIDEDEESTLLFYALRQRADCDIIRLLVDNGADIHFVNEDGISVLDEAVIFGDLEILTYLTDEKALDITTTQRKSGFTPFMQACCYNNLEVAEFILSKGADPHIKDNAGMSALDYSRRLRKKKVEAFLQNLEENQ